MHLRQWFAKRLHAVTHRALLEKHVHLTNTSTYTVCNLPVTTLQAVSPGLLMLLLAVG